MNIKPEKILFTNEIHNISDDIDRVYYGNEFCQNLIPSIYSIKKFYYSIKAMNKKFTFVTPFVTNKGLKKLEEIFIFLNKYDNVEVVFNDWGVFNTLKINYSNLIPILGRLLTKQRRDPRIPVIFSKSHRKEENLKIISAKTTASLEEHYKSAVINSEIFQNYLLSQGVRRVEIDNLSWNMKISIDKRICVSVYLPYGFIATSRKCGKITLTNAACKYECKRYFLKIKDKYSSVPLYAIGNTIFYESKLPSNNYLKRLGINRIVYQTNLPLSNK